MKITHITYQCFASLFRCPMAIPMTDNVKLQLVVHIVMIKDPREDQCMVVMCGAHSRALGNYQSVMHVPPQEIWTTAWAADRAEIQV